MKTILLLLTMIFGIQIGYSQDSNNGGQPDVASMTVDEYLKYKHDEAEKIDSTKPGYLNQADYIFGLVKITTVLNEHCNNTASAQRLTEALIIPLDYYFIQRDQQIPSNIYNEYIDNLRELVQAYLDENSDNETKSTMISDLAGYSMETLSEMQKI